MGIYVGNSVPKGIYVGNTPVKEVYVGTTKVRPMSKTFTISWEEKSDMSSGWTYSDDAAGLTAGSTAFDEFFGYSAVRLNTSGEETSEVKQTTPGQLDFSQLGTLTSGDNVMIKFPVLGIKMTKSGSTVTLSITDELGKDGYQYYAHCTGTLSNPGTPKNAFYLGAFEGVRSGNYGSYVLKSWANASPIGNNTVSGFCSMAQRNGSGYNIIGYYQRQFVNALYMMKYGNPNSQSVVGIGISWRNKGKVENTGGTVSQLSATYGTTSASQSIKLFGLENRWGNVEETIGGAYTDGNQKLYIQLSGYSGALSGGEDTGNTIQRTSGNNLSSIVGDNKALFGPSETVNNGSYNTYYCDYSDVSGSRFCMAGGYHGWVNQNGAFGLEFTVEANTYADVIGSRLMYL